MHQQPQCSEQRAAGQQQTNRRRCKIHLIIVLLLTLTNAQTSGSRAEDLHGVQPATTNADPPDASTPTAATTEATTEATTTTNGPERLTVIGPKTLRPNSDYHVLVSLAESQQPATIDLQLIGARDSNREQTESKSVLANPGETQTVKFSIGDWPPAEYVFSVTAQAVDRSWNFTQEKTLTYHAKTFSTFIQTDKAIYKPGQLVQFRSIFLTKSLAPHSIDDNSINVTVIDPKRNIAKQWQALSNYRGLLSLDFQLSEDPMLGDWTIRVQAPRQEQDTLKRFTVAEYILPTFDVTIQLPPYATYNESDIVATVRATYTYGKPVKGHVTLTVQPLVRYQYLSTRPLNQAQFRSRLTDNGGSADFKVDLVKDLKLQKDGFEREIEFFALVEEDLTGRKYNKTSSLTIYEKNIKIELLNADKTFMPGMSKQLQLKVAYQDDTPVEDNGPLMEMKFSTDAFGHVGKTLEVAKLQPVGGIVEHTLDAPVVGFNNTGQTSDQESMLYHQSRLNRQHISLEAHYRGQKYWLPGLRARQTSSGQHLQVSVPQLQAASAQRAARRRNKQTGKYSQPSLNVNDDLKIRIQTTEAIQQFSCQGLAGGNIIWALSPDAKNQTQYEFVVKVDQRMAPELRVLCFYIRAEKKEIIADSILVPVNGLVKNSIKILTNREEAKPGQEVEIGVQTRPNALIGLLAIDQSVMLLKSGNDITHRDIVDESKTYEPSSDSGSFMTTTGDVFDASNVVIITNNLIEEEPGQVGHYLMYMSAAPMASMRRTSSKIVLENDVLDRELDRPEFHLNKASKGEPLVIRSFFPETWIWTNATTDSNGQFRLKKKAPDTITSWMLSAFSIDETAGFGVTNSPTSVRIFRPFFIKLNLPYSIIRGETVNIQAVIFNYSKRPTSATVTLENKEGGFEFVEAANSIDDEKRTSQASESRLVQIPAEDGVSVSFMITPKKLGYIDIKMVARGELAADGVVRKLLVKPEGQTQHLNKAMLINLSRTKRDSTSAGSMTRNVSIDIPTNAVPGSQKIYVSAVGDLMGAGLSNPDDLLRLPDGCGEQNMINLVPNVVILNYLDSTKRLRESQRVRAVRNIEAGYQRELNYKRSDGSFSAFGQSDANGSVWLTAYVLKTFQQAKKYISVDERVIRRAANFIAGLSKSDGSIREVGMLHHKALASSSSENLNSVYLTAYSVIALMQRPIRISTDDGDISAVGPASVALDEVLERGLNYLESRLEDAVTNQESAYDLAIITYALHLANRSTSSMDRAYEQLWLRAQESRDMIWWQNSGAPKRTDPAGADSVVNFEESTFLERESDGTATAAARDAAKLQQPPPLKPLPKNDKQSEHQFVPDSLAIEMTALALLTAIKRGGPELERAFPIVNWLISKQNSNGGFASTQDTVLAIEALAAFAAANSASDSAAKSASAGPSIDLDILYPIMTAQSRQSIRKNNVDQMLIKPANALVNQRLQLPDNTSWVQLQASGSGLAVVQVAWQYNLMVAAEKPAFYLNPILDKTSNANYLQLSVCTFYKAEGESESNMAVMEVELPSGYTADLEALPGLKRSPEVKRVDTTDGETKIFIYLDKVTREELCLTIPAHRSSKVSNNKPTPVSIYDYYDRQKAARIFYEPLPSSSCDICDSDDCTARCSLKPKRSGRLQVASLHEQRRHLLGSSPQPSGSGDRLANLKSPAPSNSTTSSGIDLGFGNQTILPMERVLHAAVNLVKIWG